MPGETRRPLPRTKVFAPARDASAFLQHAARWQGTRRRRANANASVVIIFSARVSRLLSPLVGRGGGDGRATARGGGRGIRAQALDPRLGREQPGARREGCRHNERAGTDKEIIFITFVTTHR